MVSPSIPTGGVTELNLPHNIPSPVERGGLPRNRISTAIGNLTSLTKLDLTANNLSGSIPSEIGRLTNLTELQLAANDLSGSIPNLSALTSLTKLNLGNNRLSGSIPNLSALTNLTELKLIDNQLTGRIPDLSALTNLVEIELLNNRLTGRIPDLSALTNLTHLYLRENQLTGTIPTKLTDPNNPMSDRVPAFPISLTTLHLSENRLRGPIPDFSTFINLTPDSSGLWLHDNELGLDVRGQKIPMQDLHAILPSGLTFISLADNKLNGPLPDFRSRTGLTTLYLHNNNIGTQVDGTATDLSGLAANLPAALTQFSLSNNGLTGAIPNLSTLTNLTHLWLSDNTLTGPIPNTLPPNLNPSLSQQQQYRDTGRWNRDRSFPGWLPVCPPP